MGFWDLALIVGCVLLGVLVFEALFLWYVMIRYGDLIFRIFAARPLFLIPPGQPVADAEDIRFPAKGGRMLAGSYFRHTSEQRHGVIMFGHEFAANRWLADQYLGHLRAEGFDIFSFDFCNHGESDVIPGYEALHWFSDFEIEDITAAVEYLKSRPDADPRGVGYLGISKGGSSGIAATAENSYIRAIVTDGAFPTHQTFTDYAKRWAYGFVHHPWIFERLPRYFFWVLTVFAVWRIGRARKVHYPWLERRIGRLSTRPKLLIHGERDSFIPVATAKRFFRRFRGPTETWIVPKAKHNTAIDKARDEYKLRLKEFFLKSLAGIDAPAKAE